MTERSLRDELERLQVEARTLEATLERGDHLVELERRLAEELAALEQRALAAAALEAALVPEVESLRVELLAARQAHGERHSRRFRALAPWLVFLAATAAAVALTRLFPLRLPGPAGGALILAGLGLMVVHAFKLGRALHAG